MGVPSVAQLYVCSPIHYVLPTTLLVLVSKVLKMLIFSIVTTEIVDSVSGHPIRLEGRDGGPYINHNLDTLLRLIFPLRVVQQKCKIYVCYFTSEISIL